MFCKFKKIGGVGRRRVIVRGTTPQIDEEIVKKHRFWMGTNYIFMAKNAPNPPNRSELRNLVDRRKKPTNPFSIHAYRGRRKTVRRIEDRRRQPYTDHYGRGIFLLALLLILFCIGDAFFTLVHVSEGAIELNPLMDDLLKKGPVIFFVVKFVLTACGVMLLVLYWHHPLGRVVMGVAVAVYGVLFFYQIHLYVSLHPHG